MDIKQLQADLAGIVRVHQNSTCGATKNIGTAAKPNGIIHGPVRADRPNAFSNNSSSILSCKQIAVDILSQTAGSSMFELLDHALVGPGREGGVRGSASWTSICWFTCSTSCVFYPVWSDSKGIKLAWGYNISCRDNPWYFGHCISYVVVASVLLGAVVSRHLSVTDPLAARRDAFQRSSLDADREYHDSNPPITDLNDVEDVLPNHISFSKELRLQGLGKWLQHCRPPIPPLAGPAPGAILSMSLQINDHRFPSGVQPWMPISIHNVNSATTMQKTGDLAAPLVVPRADTSTNWREFTSPEGRKYYYNKVTRTSKWRMPDEVKVIWIVKRTPFRTFLIFGSISVVKTLSPDVDGSLVSAHGAKSSSTTVSPAANLPTIVASESSSLYGKVSSPMIEIVEIKNSSEPASPGDTNSEKIGIAVTLGNSVAPPIFETTTTQDAVVYGDRFSSENREAMRAVINDRRYGALKSLSEPKQAFNDVSLQVGIGMG
ncbi:hypothetical protein T459_28825 [Capsicum annuum]|uniref:WW domain-containing protein n=1 Tax=Capsicum annuum TaxID=4072 RepID=A0A2G2YHV7_CAPAN|nr:hypothetical protein T459_28825 [Capsicum annuum]